MLVLVYRKCSTCIKALNWLDENPNADADDVLDYLDDKYND